MNSTVPIRPPRLLDKQNVARFGHIDRCVERHADVLYIIASRGRKLTLRQAFRHPAADAGRLPNPGCRPEKVLTVSCRPEFFVLDVTLAQEGADCSFIPPQQTQMISLTAPSAR